MTWSEWVRSWTWMRITSGQEEQGQSQAQGARCVRQIHHQAMQAALITGGPHQDQHAPHALQPLRQRRPRRGRAAALRGKMSVG